MWFSQWALLKFGISPLMVLTAYKFVPMEKDPFVLNAIEEALS